LNGLMIASIFFILADLPRKAMPSTRRSTKHAKTAGRRDADVPRRLRRKSAEPRPSGSSHVLACAYDDGICLIGMRK
jgi:hypothetical protein